MLAGWSAAKSGSMARTAVHCDGIGRLSQQRGRTQWKLILHSGFGFLKGPVYCLSRIRCCGVGGAMVNRLGETPD